MAGQGRQPSDAPKDVSTDDILFKIIELSQEMRANHRESQRAIYDVRGDVAALKNDVTG